MSTTMHTTTRKRKQAFKPIEANTAALLRYIAKRKAPQTDAQLRASGLPPMHPSALNTLVRNGFLTEARDAAAKTSAYSITPKGRESLKLRREWLSNRLIEATTPEAQSEAATEGDGNPSQYPIEFAVAKPRTFFKPGTYDGADMARNPYRAPTVLATRETAAA